MENKKRFKLYKSGKLWCCAAIAFAIVVMGSTTVTHQVHADTNNIEETQQVMTSMPNADHGGNVDQQLNTTVTNAVGPDTTTVNNDASANHGNIDSYQITSDPKTGNANLNVKGWQVSGQSNTERYRYGILYDNTDHREIARQSITPQNRVDVQQAYSNVDNSLQSGFNIDFKLPTNLAGHSISLVARYSTDAINGEDQHADYWFAPIILDNQNRASLDSLSLSDQGNLVINGWHASNQALGKRHHYIIVVDETTGKELARQEVTPVNRDDVAKAYPTIANGNISGFQAKFSLNSAYGRDHIQIVSRWTNDPAGNGQSVDYWFNPLNEQNVANLDNLSSDSQGNLHISGWHATNQALGKSHHFIIVYDQTRQREITRQEVTQDNRSDVSRAYPMIANAGVSGFSTTFKLTPQYAEDNIQIVSRWTNDKNGNGDTVDYWFGPVQKQNRGNLDSWQLSSGQLEVSGWHANDASIYEPYHYLIVFDNTNGQQVNAIQVQNIVSDDVAKVYGNDTCSANNARFKSNFGDINLVAGHTYSLVSRYSATNGGNGDDGNGADHTDYWFSLGTLNGVAYNIDGWSNDGTKLTINGWFANDQSLTHQYPYVILLVDGQEVARKLVQLTERSDVARAYPHIANSAKSGFTVTFDTPKDVQNNLQLVLRFANTENGEGDHQDIWTPTFVNNAGHFDQVDINGNTIHITGWHAAVNNSVKPYEYIIAVDGGTGREIQRWNITNGAKISRPDVFQSYPWLENSGQSGFDMHANNLSGDWEYVKLIHRFTDDAAGNGNYIDYEQTIDRTNYAQRLLQAWQSIINEKPGHIGIAVKSQLTGQVYSYTNAPGYHWMTMSTVKVAVLSELLHRTGGNLDGTMQDLATRMIRYSDNNATTAITNNYLGGAQGLRPLYERLGMWNTGTNSTWGSSWTTPEDQIKLLNDLYLDQNSGYLNEQSRNYIHYQMNNVSAGQDWGISAGTPRGSFYIKNGWMPWGYEWVNSIGFIPSSDNRHGYAIAVYTDGDASFQSGINVIEQLARATKNILQ